ncbi:MAG: hypothetical protein KAU99_03910 [Thermoplasmata archaeon]|nr:hypothetical protein [Thermoplasmata archaeon]
MEIEPTLVWLIIGGTLIGISVAVMAIFKKEGSCPMVFLFMGLAFVILYFEPLKEPVNLGLLLFLAAMNAIWIGLLAQRLVPRFAILVAILGVVMTLLYAFLLSF